MVGLEAYIRFAVIIQFKLSNKIKLMYNYTHKLIQHLLLLIRKSQKLDRILKCYSLTQYK